VISLTFSFKWFSGCASSFLCIGPRLTALLAQLPATGDLLPTLKPEDYFAEYNPVVTGMPFASVGLVFTSEPPDATAIRGLMEAELASWLSRYRVPLFVSSFDVKGDLIQLVPESHLMGYLDSENHLTKRWGTLNDAELPADQVTHWSDCPLQVPGWTAKSLVYSTLSKNEPVSSWPLC
jgi:hypothetical protein